MQCNKPSFLRPLLSLLLECWTESPESLYLLAHVTNHVIGQNIPLATPKPTAKTTGMNARPLDIVYMFQRYCS